MRRRETDQWVSVIWRNAVPAIAIGLAAWGLHISQNAVGVSRGALHVANGQVTRIQEGRRTSLNAICAVTSAVVDAGRATITGPPTSSKVDRALRKLGFPSGAQRAAAAQDTADRYERTITQRVERQTGVAGLVNSDGTFNCSRLTAVAHAR